MEKKEITAGAAIAALLELVLLLCGAFTIGYGLWLIFRPLAYIFGGVALIYAVSCADKAADR